jgi:hypothetical protein
MTIRYWCSRRAEPDPGPQRGQRPIDGVVGGQQSVRVADAQQPRDGTTRYQHPPDPCARAVDRDSMQRQEPLRAKELQIAEIDDHSAAMPRLHDIFGEGARVRPVDVAIGADNGYRRHRPPSIEFCSVTPAEWSRSIGSHFGSIRFVEPGWIPVRSTRVAANLLRVFCGGSLQPAPVQRPLCASGATAPTMIQERNVAPVGPEGR